MHIKDGHYICCQFHYIFFTTQERRVIESVAHSEAEKISRARSDTEEKALLDNLTELEKAKYPDASLFPPNKYLFTNPSVKYASQPAYAKPEMMVMAGNFRL